ncbi:MAG: hypothetical protein HKP30_10090 [Myxococcales bacterium]|nr:hypothetical protein [Myxococcales bacterium]
MFHDRRIWTLADIDSPRELAEKLTQQTFVLCQGFRWNGLLLLNDSLSEDGAQEYGVVDAESGIQLDSLTVSWMTPERFLACLEEVAKRTTAETAFGRVDLATRLDAHGYGRADGPCPHCA